MRERKKSSGINSGQFNVADSETGQFLQHEA